MREALIVDAAEAAGVTAASAAATAVSATRERLADELTAMEECYVYDVDATLARVVEIQRVAEGIGDIGLQLRARLLMAYISRRDGDLAAVARVCWEVNIWAAEHADRSLLCRSHVMLSAVYQGLGDAAATLEHAVFAAGFLDDDTRPRARAHCLMRLGDSLGVSGSFEAARERYRQAEQVTVASRDVELRLMILNNLAYTDQMAGNIEGSWVTIEQIRAIAAETGEPLNSNALDTIARVEIDLGRYDEAEQTARVLIERHDPAAAQDPDSLAEYWLTRSAAQRHRGAIDAARASLDACVTFCTERGLAAIRVRAMEEEAELYAAAGDLGQAFTTHKAFHQAYQELLSTQREAQALTRQVMLEVAEARREAEQFREQARRDPLTGLRNRRFVGEQLPLLLEHSARAGSPVTVALLDLDHFKRINDTCSHEVGDRVLATFADLLANAGAVSSGATALGATALGATALGATASRVADPTGFAARLGGEEFLLVVTDVSPAEAIHRLDDLRRMVAAHAWEPLTGALPVTVSVGVTVADPGSTETELLVRADASLYAAKHGGRNRVCVDPAVSLADRRTGRADRTLIG